MAKSKFRARQEVGSKAMRSGRCPKRASTLSNMLYFLKKQIRLEQRW